MTAKQKILEFLQQNKYTAGGYTPTQIGMALGKPYATASSSCATPLKQLVAEGSVKRQVSSPGLVKYFVEIK